jgi:hypothetical protein
MKRIKNIALLTLILVICSCTQTKQEEKLNPIAGNWQFLDMRGNYNEAFFNDTSYFTYNQVYGKAPDFVYELRGSNDSLFSNIDKRKKGMNFIAKLTWLHADTVIFKTEFTTDTLGRILDGNYLLGNTDLLADSTFFMNAYNQRYESFLIAKGILSAEEVKQFKEKNIVPEDVKK